MAARSDGKPKHYRGTRREFSSAGDHPAIIHGALFEHRVTAISGDDAARDLMLFLGLLLACGEGAGSIVPSKPLRVLIVTGRAGVADEIAAITSEAALFPAQPVTIHRLYDLTHGAWGGTETLAKVVNVTAPRIVIVDDVPLATVRAYLGITRAAVISTEADNHALRLTLTRRGSTLLLTDQDKCLAQFERDGKRFRAASANIGALVRAAATREPVGTSARAMLDDEN